MKLAIVLSNTQKGVIKRLKNKGFKNLYYCPDCGSIHHYTSSDYVPYSSHSYYKCKSCGAHIWTELFHIDQILRSPVNINREDMHYYSEKHRQHLKTENNMPKSKKEYEVIHNGTKR